MIPLRSKIKEGYEYHQKIVNTWEKYVKLLKEEIENPKVSALEKSRMEIELLEQEVNYKHKVRVFEEYMKRATDWNFEWEKTFARMDGDFEDTVAKCESLETKTINMATALNVWKTAKDEQKSDSEFKYKVYETLKQELENVK